MLTKRLEKKLDGNNARILRANLNKSWRQHPTRHKLYGHLPPIAKTIQVRRTRHAGHSWRSRDELISDVFLWTPIYGRAKAGRPARTYIQQLCEDTGCSPEDRPEAMKDREKWRERVRDVRAIYMYKEDLALNNLQWLICHKTQHNPTKSYISSSSSSCRAGSTDIPDPLSPLLPIVHHPRQVFWTTSRILT